MDTQSLISGSITVPDLLTKNGYNIEKPVIRNNWTNSAVAVGKWAALLPSTRAIRVQIPLDTIFTIEKAMTTKKGAEVNFFMNGAK